MTLEQLQEDILLQLSAMEQTVCELQALGDDVGVREPSRREMAAAAAFLADFYGGFENILKRICRFHNCPLPEGESWHIELFEWFCTPARKPLEPLLDETLEQAMDPYRRFRHIVHHGYVLNLDWHRLMPGIQEAPRVFDRLKSRLIEIYRLGK